MISKLPMELLTEIIGHLDYCTILAVVKLICRAFNDAASAFSLYRGLTPSIWASIFSNLDYLQLKTEVAATCKPFYRIVNSFDHPELAAKLFREDVKLSSKIGKTTDVKMHPAFEMVSNECYDKIEHVYFINWETEKEIRLLDAGCADENATSPPTTQIIVKFGVAPPKTVTSRRRKNPQPITVLEVMNACCNAMAAEPHELEKMIFLAECRFFDEKLGFNDEQAEAQMEKITYRDFQGDHTGFTGFDKVTAHNGGGVTIESIYFDS